MKNKFDKFYLKTAEERIKILDETGKFDQSFNINLDAEIANNMIENYITNYEIPLGVTYGMVINDKEYIVPMVTEEPSVIAACTNACKIIKKNGGFTAKIIDNTKIGQICINTLKPDLTMDIIKENMSLILDIANASLLKNRKYNCEVHNILLTKKENFVIMNLHFTTGKAMGANIINTTLEKVSAYLRTQLDQEVLMSILSNLTPDCYVEATCKINVNDLKETNTASRIEQAYKFANIDSFRAVTHNKGIMNGVIAFVLATGNDTRAVEANCHAYASLFGSYSPLSKWEIINDILVGTIKIPINIGSVGGSINTNPKARLSKSILGTDDINEYMMIASCCGLANNFGALNALVTDGIQKGHMSLHAKNIAMTAGAKGKEINDVASELINSSDFSLENAKRILKKEK